jgi:glycosyltransferase involved in cell wall biosynthesis
MATENQNIGPESWGEGAMASTKLHPAISITVPVYNASAFISETVQSVLNQTFTDFELILVDDCSTDDTVAKIQAFNDPRVRLICNPQNTGLIAKNRNNALAAAQGDYIGFFDADDVMEPHCLETLITYLRAHPDCTAVFGNFRRINEHGQWLDTPIDESCVIPLPHDGQRYAPLIHRAFPITWPNILTSKVHNQIQCLLMPRATLNRVGPFKQNSLQFAEYNLTIRLFLDNFEGVHYLPQALFRYRQVSKSQTRNKTNFRRYVEFLPVLMNWIYSFPPIQQGAWHARSWVTANMYAHFLRSRLDLRDMANLQYCLAMAWQDPHVTHQDWCRVCLPYWLRGLLPAGAERKLRRCFGR